METYHYLAEDRTSLDFEKMIDDLQSKTAPGDAVLLHGCCHNPTGIDPTHEQWMEIARVLAAQQLLPVVDLAYQGFGAGLQEDVAGLHEILSLNEEAIVCSSFSKNFGLYGERVGGMSLIAADAAAAAASMSQLKRLVRCNYSNPPRHGASIVSTVLGDPTLTAMWHDELATMRARIDCLALGIRCHHEGQRGAVTISRSCSRRMACSRSVAFFPDRSIDFVRSTASISSAVDASMSPASARIA